MPAQPSWFPRLSEILAELRSLEQIPYLDRQAFERLFHVRDRRARVLMSRFGGLQIGNAWVIDRQELIRALETIQRGEDFQWEQWRRRRIAAFYQEAEREHPARQVQIPVKRESLDHTLTSLPSGVELDANELRIRFSSFEEFLTKLFEVGQAVQNDFENFNRFFESHQT
jgi:hypothetical protein